MVRPKNRLSAFSTGASRLGPNLLVNASAEQGTDGWVANGSSPLESVAAGECGVAGAAADGSRFFVVGGACASPRISGHAHQRIDVSAYGEDCGAIIFANPNAPTGIALPLPEIERLLQAHPDKPIVIDEAYVDFGAESAIPLIARHPNLLVTHTLSKSRALAGLRVGLAIGSRELIDALERVKDSFNSYPLDRLAQAGAIAAYEDED